MMRKILIETEDLLGRLPRLVLLALAVFVLCNPLLEGGLEARPWYLKMPCEFAVLLLFALALCAGLRLAAGNRYDRG